MSKALARKIFGQLGTLGSLAQVSTGQNVPLVLITGQAETQVSHKRPGQNVLLVLKEQVRQSVPKVLGHSKTGVWPKVHHQSGQSERPLRPIVRPNHAGRACAAAENAALFWP